MARKDADALRFPAGGVLAVAQALPFWATLLSRAAAVVAERGSAAGHLANVAREYGVPALFGLSGALAALEGAGMVTVDADGRRVLPGDATADLPRRERPRNLMLGSPVHGLLARAAERIVPLTLLDPTAPEFTPEGCATLHDITASATRRAWRRCSARARTCPCPPRRPAPVRGRAGHAVLGHRPGRRLCRAGGGQDRAPGEHRLRAHAGPVAGHDRRALGRPSGGRQGFMSVLAGSAANPDLDPAQASAFADKNYFMIASDFCSLQSRFGYHFSTVEALIGPGEEDETGNYLSFRFRAGPRTTRAAPCAPP